MFGQVQEVGLSKNGKPKCKIAGVVYFLPTDRDTGYGATPEVGRTIEYEVGKPFTIGDPPKTFQTIDKWRVPEAGAPAPQPAKHAPAEKPAGYIDEASLRFISNVVGQAIAAQTIKEPGQILAWFNAAKTALEGKPAAAPFDDRLPYSEDDRQQANSRW